MQTKTSIGFLAVLLALAGCDNPPPADPDSGTTPDSGMTTADGGTDSGSPPLEGCDAARAVALTDGEQTLTGNTTDMGSEVDLGDACGFEATPQEILALTVPGTGEKTVTFDLAVGTTAFDTIVQVRPDSCESLTDAVCFDDVAYPDEPRSAGYFVAEGGSTVYLIVSGFSFPDEEPAVGRWTMEVGVSDTTPAPTLAGGEVVRVGAERYDFILDGGDPDGGALGFRFTMLDAAGADIAVDADGDPETPEQAEFDWDFDESLADETTFTDALGTLAVPEFVAATSAATQVRVALRDRHGLLSAPMTLAIRTITVVGRGETCNADAICGPDLECIAATCQTPAATVAACATATALVVTEATPSTTAGSVEPGTGHLSPSCVNGAAPHAEDIYTVVVPAGAFDLIASTDNTVTGEADTAVFIQSTCGDTETEVTCDDDGGEELRSIATVEDATGTYTIGVEIVGTHDAAAAYQLDVRLRPVIGADAACDPMEIMNRCSTGACPTGDTPVCPAAVPPAP